MEVGLGRFDFAGDEKCSPFDNGETRRDAKNTRKSF